MSLVQITIERSFTRHDIVCDKIGFPDSNMYGCYGRFIMSSSLNMPLPAWIVYHLIPCVILVYVLLFPKIYGGYGISSLPLCENETSG